MNTTQHSHRADEDKKAVIEEAIKKQTERKKSYEQKQQQLEQTGEVQISTLRS
jgi:hypothetical protein